MKEKVLKTIADVALKTAKTAGHTASFFGLYQPKEPKNLNNKNEK